MAGEEELCEAYPMKGGDGPSSYANNSTYQKGAGDAAKELVNKIIAEKLDMEIFTYSNTFRVADLGCSVGPNTFFSVENIIESLQFKYRCQALNSQVPEFQVFFNDHAQNDFNMLFRSLPPDRQYYAAGVPGSFYGRLFPNASIHLFHSSFALPWLSRVPKGVVDENCPAWNKGRIYYSDDFPDVVRAYEAQRAEDMECFLQARAQEIVYGGLVVLINSARPDGTPHSHTLSNVSFQILGSCLMDMATKGVVDEDKVNSFNIPTYFLSPRELEAVVERNGCFSVESTESLPNFSHDMVITNTQILASHIRATLEGLIKQQFGEKILDELFELFGKKLEEQHSLVESSKEIVFLLVLRRKAN